MRLGFLTWLFAWLRPRQRRGIKSFEHELQAAGGVAGRVDSGLHTIPTAKVVGSVSRWRELGSDFFYRTGKGVTARYRRIGAAMRGGAALPAVEVYRLKKLPRGDEKRSPSSEYYVVDGHHRVAMARKLGQDFLDAHIISYKASSPDAGPSQHVPPSDQPPPDETVAGSEIETSRDRASG
jgi:hypothetical protein